MTFGRIVALLALAALAGWPDSARAAPPGDSDSSKLESSSPTPTKHSARPTVAKSVLGSGQLGENLPLSDAWQPYDRGFERQADAFFCDNRDDARARRGVTQTVELNQVRPEPIIAACWSKAEGVSGAVDADYSIYLDLIYSDGTPLWGRSASFSIGTHDWQRRQVMVLPEKPVKQVVFYMLFRGHGGKAWFRAPELRVVRSAAGACLFDGLPVATAATAREGFQLRDVATRSDFVFVSERGVAEAAQPKANVLGIDVAWKTHDAHGATFSDADVADATGKDRAVTLVFAVPLAADGLRWWVDPRRSEAVAPGREYVNATQFQAGSNGRLSRYPLGAATNSKRGVAIGVDPVSPALLRIGYSVGTGELYVAYDIGLAREKPRAHVRFCRFTFPPERGFRGALARYYELFPAAFRRRVSEQGNWMPFAKISQVQGWQDFGFRFKEGNDETAWDDAHGILTFRYTEPMTWWMAMPKGLPRTFNAAVAEAERLAKAGNREAQALFSSGYHDAEGRLVPRLLDTPWCNGAVWSMNSMPEIAGKVTDFQTKWSPAIQEQLYGLKANGDLDGEYVDSSEGYVTDELDFRRDHLAAAQTPLTFSPEEHRPAILRGLIAFEYVRGIETDIHRRGKLMMANATPDRLFWLAPMCDVLGTETNWNWNGKWQPMSDAEMLYRRALCKGKPFCFLMNTSFDRFSYEMVEKYMKRCLAYGMFPGFFSADAASGHYFTRPDLYNRDRPLFKRYVPLCKRVAEAGWEPLTLARTDDEHVYVERFGSRYLTVFNDSPQPRTITLTLDAKSPEQGRNLLTGRTIVWRDSKTTLSLESEDVAVIEASLESS